MTLILKLPIEIFKQVLKLYEQAIQTGYSNSLILHKNYIKINAYNLHKFNNI